MCNPGGSCNNSDENEKVESKQVCTLHIQARCEIVEGMILPEKCKTKIHDFWTKTSFKINELDLQVQVTNERILTYSLTGTGFRPFEAINCAKQRAVLVKEFIEVKYNSKLTMPVFFLPLDNTLPIKIPLKSEKEFKKLIICQQAEVAEANLLGKRLDNWDEKRHSTTDKKRELIPESYFDFFDNVINTNPDFEDDLLDELRNLFKVTKSNESNIVIVREIHCSILPGTISPLVGYIDPSRWGHKLIEFAEIELTCALVKHYIYFYVRGEGKTFEEADAHLRSIVLQIVEWLHESFNCELSEPILSGLVTPRVNEIWTDKSPSNQFEQPNSELLEEITKMLARISARFNEISNQMLKHYQESLEEFKSINAALMERLKKLDPGEKKK
jgi:hypothetical protein